MEIKCAGYSVEGNAPHEGWEDIIKSVNSTRFKEVLCGKIVQDLNQQVKSLKLNLDKVSGTFKDKSVQLEQQARTHKNEVDKLNASVARSAREVDTIKIKLTSTENELRETKEQFSDLATASRVCSTTVNQLRSIIMAIKRDG